MKNFNEEKIKSLDFRNFEFFLTILLLKRVLIERNYCILIIFNIFINLFFLYLILYFITQINKYLFLLLLIKINTE